MTLMLETTADTFCNSPSGCDCTFLKIGSTGIKVYNDPEVRDRSYVNQYRLHRSGLAPSVGYKYEVQIGGKNDKDSWTGYGFETGIVEVYDGWHYSDLARNDDSAARAYRKRFSDAGDELTGKLHDAGIDWNDNHAGNVGFDPETGNAVLIDCADDLFGSWRIGADAEEVTWSGCQF